MPKRLKALFLITDIGFLMYWTVTALVAMQFLHIPPEFLFKDYANPIMIAWNWSFMPLDILASVTGLLAVAFMKRGQGWKTLALISMVLTFCAGFMAICFWSFQGKFGGSFEISWWLPNLFLMLWPIMMLKTIVSKDVKDEKIG